MNPFSLLSEHRFRPFFWTQFSGAMNDNIFKTALITILTYDALSWTTIDPSLLNNLVPALFILPFLLLSATAGQIADKYPKERLAQWVKLFEVLIMGITAVGWLTHTLWLLLVGVVAMGIHSTVFGPIKYAYLPQHLKSNELIAGNGLVEMGTFVGILVGEILGAVLVVYKPWGLHYVAIATVAVSMFGWWMSRSIPSSPAPVADLRINWNPITETVRNIGYSMKNRTVFLSMLGNSWFWFYGAIMLAQFPLYAKNYLHGDHDVFVLLLVIFSVGIGLGSILCEKLSGHKIEIGLVPFGSFGLTVFGVDLYFASLAYTNTELVSALQFVSQAGSLRVLFDCAMIGVFGGFYIVPLFALIQTRCDPNHLSRTIAGMNILNALFMVVASLLAMVLLKAGLSIPELFLVTALLNAAVAVYIYTLVPEFLLRFLAWILIHTVHKVKKIDTHNIPEEGPAVLVCNHVSYVDAIAILASSPRPIRFIMDARIFAVPVLSWLFRSIRAIPILPAKDNPEVMQKALDSAAEALENGELVCIFPEGRLTTTGDMGEFKGGIKKIIDRTPVPVIPMALRGLWGSMLTKQKSNPFSRGFKRGIRSQLTLAVGPSVAPENATPEYLQTLVAELRGVEK